MQYRVAIQVDPSPTWKWRSTVLSTPYTLLEFLRLYRALPQDRLRVFTSPTREGLDEQLVQENNGGGSQSVTAAQFLQERMIGSREVTWRGSECGTRGNQETASTSAAIKPSLNESSTGAQPLYEGSEDSLERRWGELERGAGGDHDLPYTFTLPTSMPQVLVWIRLLVRVQDGQLQP